MKLLINNKYQDVNFWSFLKCTILTQLGLLGLIYGTLFVIGIAIAISGLAFT